MKRTLPPLNALRAFEAYARHGKLAAAAEELCVTHGAVSRQVKRLEAYLGVQLVARGAAASRFTKEGKRYAGALHHLLDELERITPTAPLKVARKLELLCPGAFSIKWLLPRLGRFAAYAPDIRLEVIDESGPWRPVSDVSRIAIRMQSYEGAPASEVDSDVFMDRFTGPVLAPHWLAGRSIPEEKLLRLPRLYTRSIAREWPDWGAAAGRSINAAAKEIGFDRSFHTFEAAVSGLGVAIGDWAMVKAELDSGQLAAPLGFVRSPWPYVLLRRKGDDNPDIRTFRTWLVEEGLHAGAPTSAKHADHL